MPGRVYQLKATIVDTNPSVWRRVLVDEATTLSGLHHVLQAAFGWWDCHRHSFVIAGVGYGTDEGEPPGPLFRDERRTRLGEVAAAGTTLAYIYDFGDNWRHRLVVERVAEAEVATYYPACTEGRRACPPEDCGGVEGYERLLAVISDPTHDGHDSMLGWVGGRFDPDVFDPAAFDPARFGHETVALVP